MRATKIVRSLAAAGLITALGVSGVAYYQPEAAHAAVEAASTPVQKDAPAALPDFSRLAERYGPAVVNISVTHEAKPQAGVSMPELGMNPGDPSTSSSAASRFHSSRKAGHRRRA